MSTEHDTTTGNPQGRNRAPVMPALATPEHAFRHNVDSAFFSLLDLDVDPDRITFQKAGRGYADGCVVFQDPEPLQDISNSREITLGVGGDGLFDRIPTALRDRGTPAEPGIDTLLFAFDDAVEKANCYSRHPSPLFHLGSHNLNGCERWIRLFGVEPEDWPETTWPILARLVPVLQTISGHEIAIRLGLKLLLDLDVTKVECESSYTMLGDQEVTRLGLSFTRLGVDFIAGRAFEGEAVLKLTLGPMSLECYHKHQSSQLKRLLASALQLVMPCHRELLVDWIVGNPRHMPCLNTPEDNTVLGINMRLGEEAPPQAEFKSGARRT